MKELAYILLGYLIVKGARMVSQLDSTKLRWPVAVLGQDGKELPGRGGSVITQEYRPPTHMGVDISVPGHYRDAVALIRAVAAGRVVRATRGARGGYVLIDHGDWASGYLHLAEMDVASGEMVQAGERLGRMGADPLDAEGVVHLHLQFAPYGNTTDPAPYLLEAV